MLSANFTINCLHHKKLEGHLDNFNERETIALTQGENIILFDLHEARILMDRIEQAARSLEWV